ncbi:DNA ligase D [Virgibacillus phasianinus]|uniref:DNA ligase (ATP) n=2 Tax=Virgibacillus phasianinus TaxID=2017483 RepID=A0A220U9H8_9BACI|nr:DNA ligase D [Virgibacillus phasianinus]ASK64403.1 DNA ligase D [Virgibacillus phasianinus]
MKLMQPIPRMQIPTGNEWVYEVKYDGFRCVLHWEKDTIRLFSRNDVELTTNFPEIISFCSINQAIIEEYLPVELDGEIVIINNEFQANFPAIQKRGRLNKKETIDKAAGIRPATFLAFDLLRENGSSLMNKTYSERKKELSAFFKSAKFEPSISRLNRLSLIPSYRNADELWEIVFAFKGEGVIAKKKGSFYGLGKQHTDWLKIKNWRKFEGILTDFDTKNDYFNVKVYDGDQLVDAGKCKHGVDESEIATLHELFTTKGTKSGSEFRLPPAICAEVNTLDFVKHEIREPSINRILVNTNAADCTVQKMKVNMAMLPETVEASKINKLFWPEDGVTKGDLLTYLREISPYMLPFLKDRILTLIRCPDGVQGEYFFQKHLPDYAPSFITSYPTNDEVFFICNKLETLLWFGNHGALEFHTPFQTAGSANPAEIVFDLDPPDRERFPLAIQAANILKQMLDDLKLISFVKTSGNKGIQVHIPIPKDSLTYDETGIFTEAIAMTMENAYPALFTTERLKKNRKERMYIDYVQHAMDKTIINAYSPRKTNRATVSTPLFWEEVKEGLTPEMFTINNVAERVKTLGCPFTGYNVTGERQQMTNILNLLRQKK